MNNDNNLVNKNESIFKINNNNNFRNSFFLNKINPLQMQITATEGEDENLNKLFIGKIQSNPNIIRIKNNKIVKQNNYINMVDNKSKNLYKLIPHSDSNNKKSIKKSQVIVNNFINQKSKSNLISPNKIIRKKNNINNNNDINTNNIPRYGSFDKYFLNDNNYEDKSYIEYINTIKDNFNVINYANLDKIKQKSFKDDKILQLKQINKNLNNNNFLIQRGNNLNIINNSQRYNLKNINESNNNNGCQKINNINKTFNSNRDKNKIYQKSCLKNFIKSKERRQKNKNNEKNNMQINNNFNVNNNTNYYNFNYNPNENNKYKINKLHNKNKKYDFEKNKAKKKLKSNIKNCNNYELLTNKKEENSANENVIFFHDYSNDDLIHTSEMYNSINDGTNFEYVKRPSNYFENKN